MLPLQLPIQPCPGLIRLSVLRMNEGNEGKRTRAKQIESGCASVHKSTCIFVFDFFVFGWHEGTWFFSRVLGLPIFGGSLPFDRSRNWISKKKKLTGGGKAFHLPPPPFLICLTWVHNGVGGVDRKYGFRESLFLFSLGGKERREKKRGAEREKKINVYVHMHHKERKSHDRNGTRHTTPLHTRTYGRALFTLPFPPY